ncbi:ATP-binding response regulator [Ideonella sp. BN130291]|uniref:ATP-binding response regulator n=1 Tax=Ideonella sp. BN130291 TaxID=3112940 RepID=UPI002E26A9DE|nr:hybrid sensor histidine kinase/response regulator [Ideonella sp. BN130291]
MAARPEPAHGRAPTPRPLADPAADAPLPLSPPDTRRQLLSMVGSRASAELAGLVIPPVLLWTFPAGRDSRAVWAWACAYWLMSLLVVGARRAFRRDLATLAPEPLHARWLPRFHWAGVGYGLCWGGLAVAALDARSFEYGVLVYLVLAASTASAAAFATGVMGVFRRYFFACWSIALPAVPWVFPLHWHAVLPLALLYCAMVWRHARHSHAFLVEQAGLKEQSAHLAEQHRAASEEARRALAAKSYFLATASHDLRQPLYALALTVQTARERNADPALAPVLDELRHAASNINEMFDSLLDLSRIEAGVYTPQLQPCDLGTLLAGLHAQCAAEAAARGLAWRLRLPACTVLVHADPLLLRRAVSNLLHNALRYTPAGGVLLACRRRGAHWQVQVWDTGVGVADASHERIFSPFYREGNAWSVSSEGHGLGLSVVAECARLMDARIGVSSRLGKGSCFWLALPLAARDAVAAIPMPGASAALPPLGGRCLVIDDDPGVTAAWRGLLAAWQVDARFAAHGKQALAHLEAGFRPQVLLCDQRLRSAESGFQLMQALLERLPDARGAMVSGELQSPELAAADAEGYVVLRKPVAPEALHALLQRWLREDGAAG